jgi:hypothetical protein
MKTQSYLELGRLMAYGPLVEFDVEPATTRVECLGWDMTVIARMPQKRIPLKMKTGVILGQQLAVQADRMLMTIDESYYPVAGRGVCVCVSDLQ